MNNEIKHQWVAALRSGEYQQGVQVLRKEDKFCCLGVLCDLYGKEHNTEWEKDTKGGYAFMNHHTYLPESVAEWADLEDTDPQAEDHKIGSAPLAYLNDNGRNFKTIAQLIEEQL